MIMDIVIVAQYLRDIEDFEGNNSRFVYLAKMLTSKYDNKVEIITSDFNHMNKKHFLKVGELPGIKVTALHESGYPRNICLKRFVSHKELSKNVEKYLIRRAKPDVIYCAVPSLDVADVVATYCRKNDVRFIADIQDLWPEAFEMVFHVPLLSGLIFKPLQKQANRIYKTADDVIAVSKTYAERAMCVNKKCKLPIVVYLGTEKESFDRYADNLKKKDIGITIGYVGSMSASYDLISVINAIANIKINVPIKLLAMGDGSLKNSFIKHAKNAGINAEFTGKLPYSQMVKRLLTCDIAVNPIRRGSAGSIINKVGDYAMAGLPVINTQESEEYRNLLVQYKAGINCECENSMEIANAIKKLITDYTLRKKMSENSRKLGEECFDRKKTYYKLVEKLLKNSEGTQLE